MPFWTTSWRCAMPECDGYAWGVVGNGRSAALIDRRSRVVFACLPAFDSGSVFAEILDELDGGVFGVSVLGGEAVAQAYEDDTCVLVTRWESPEGVLEVIDFMPRFRRSGEGREYACPPDLIRLLRVVAGSPRVRVEYRPRLEFACHPTQTFRDGDRLKSITDGGEAEPELYESVYLYSDLPLAAIERGEALPLSEDAFLLLSYNDKLVQPSLRRVRLSLAKTRAYWMNWCSHTREIPPWRDMVMRSAMTLKLMQYAPTGALVAAATTSLPELIGEGRNWDYRFCWVRDASMTVSVLERLGHGYMARNFVDWLLRTVQTKDDHIQIMYGLRGEKDLSERSLDHLRGYRGSRPVRLGNAAWMQTQNDIYGVLLDVIWRSLPRYRPHGDAIEGIWTRVRSVTRTVERHWQAPDRGIWELRSEARHFVFSKVLCWVAIDRAIRIARALGKVEWANAHLPLHAAIRAEVERRGWNANVGAYTQSYGSPHMDAANLLMAEYGFVDARDPRYVATVEQSLRELCRDGLMYRYRNPDDFGEPASAFTVCSFWMVKALHRIGRKAEARRMFEDLLAGANHVGLLSEDMDFATRRQLGNFPQAYSHLALIDCAMALAAEEDGA